MTKRKYTKDSSKEAFYSGACYANEKERKELYERHPNFQALETILSGDDQEIITLRFRDGFTYDRLTTHLGFGRDFVTKEHVWRILRILAYTNRNTLRRTEILKALNTYASERLAAEALSISLAELTTLMTEYEVECKYV